MESNKKKINWISILQGWGMLLVVIGHVVLTNEFKNPDYPLSSKIEEVIYGFHMPLFMFISGLLFFLTKIRGEKPYRIVVSDKLKRLGIPYIFFTGVTFTLKYAFNPFMNRQVDLSLGQIADSFIYPETNPLSELWFVATLLAIFILYPVFVYTIKSNIRIFFTLTVFILLNIYFPKEVVLLCISQVAYMLIFFYCGVLFLKKDMFKLFEKWYIFILSSILFVFANIIDDAPALLMALLGISFSISLCIKLSKVIPSLFSTFRDYTFQIFLLGIFFQMGIRYLYVKLASPCLYLPLYIISILVALYVPVLIAKLIQRVNSRYLNRCFGL